MAIFNSYVKLPEGNRHGKVSRYSLRTVCELVHGDAIGKSCAISSGNDCYIAIVHMTMNKHVFIYLYIVNMIIFHDYIGLPEGRVYDYL